MPKTRPQDMVPRTVVMPMASSFAMQVHVLGPPSVTQLCTTAPAATDWTVVRRIPKEMGEFDLE